MCFLVNSLWLIPSTALWNFLRNRCFIIFSVKLQKLTQFKKSNFCCQKCLFLFLQLKKLPKTCPKMSCAFVLNRFKKFFEKILLQSLFLNPQGCVEDLVSKIKEGANASIYDLCVASDEKIVALLAPHYVKQKVPKGVAFPTCISPNMTTCHYSPANKEKSLKIQPGDVIKIEMGAHLDNFATYVAHTVVVPQTSGSENTLCIPPEHEKPFLAMHYIKELVCHALVPENKPEALIKQAIAVAESLNCTLGQNIKCMRLSRSLEDVDDKYFSLNPTAEMRKDSNTLVFKTDELYYVDIILSKEVIFICRVILFLKAGVCNCDL